jgi:hypothetical protein
MDCQPGGVLAVSGGMRLLDMLKRYAFSFYEVVVRIERARRTASVDSGRVNAYRLEELSESLTQIRAECVKLDLVHTPDLISHVESEVLRRGKDYTCEDMVNHLETLASSFATELRKELFFRIADERIKYFENVDLFGSQVNFAFPSCGPDITNAGNCCALEQNDASAFHSMKILERGLCVLAKKFGVDFSHTNWHNVIEQIEKQIRNMNSSFGPDWKEQQKFYSQAALHFMFLKDAWRNHIMHVGDVYDEGRALSILSHVRELMLALAKGGLAE